MNIVFLGTPDFALASLEKLYNSRHNILAVVTQPDKEVGRKKEIVFSPVKQFALSHNIKIFQFNKIRLEGVIPLKELKPDIMISCAYGQILSQEIIDIAKYGIINVHGSLLPKYRGASPIQASILNGDKTTGVTIMQTDVGIDSGDILAVKSVEIGEDENSGELFDRLKDVGADLLIETLDKIENNEIIPIKQDESLATHVKMISKEDALIDFNNSFEDIHNLVRGMNPWPVAFTHLNDKVLKIFKVEKSNYVGECGKVLYFDIKNGFIVGCKNGSLSILELQLEGGKKMPIKDFIIGRKCNVGDFLK